MSNTLEYAEYLKAIRVKVSELDSLLNKELDFKLNEVLESYASLFNRFCPYKIGDRVKLREDLTIRQNSGWYGSRHFLVRGAIATVKTYGDYRQDLFYFGLEFDDESYINQHGEIRPVGSKHLFYLSENEIQKLF